MKQSTIYRGFPKSSIQNLRVYFLSLLFLIGSSVAFGQNLYKTPKGEHYHTGNCKRVKNFSHKIEPYQIAIDKLDRCSSCKPPLEEDVIDDPYEVNISAGVLLDSVSCQGHTLAGKACSRNTYIANHHCFQHVPLDNN